MSRFLSHEKTKADFTSYLAAKILEYNMGSTKLIITSASGHTQSNKDQLFQDNNHEEADTLLIHQAVLASQRNPPDAQLVFFSPDTDVLVLVTANYDVLLKNTSISMASGVVQIEPLWRALSLKADEDVINALQMLLEEADMTEGMLSTLATFVCTAYTPKGISIKTIPDLRWYLFCTHMAEGHKLPPTIVALKQQSISKHGCGDMQPSLSRIHSWIPWKMGTSKTQMVS